MSIRTVIAGGFSALLLLALLDSYYLCNQSMQFKVTGNNKPTALLVKDFNKRANTICSIFEGVTSEEEFVQVFAQSVEPLIDEKTGVYTPPLSPLLATSLSNEPTPPPSTTSHSSSQEPTSHSPSLFSDQEPISPPSKRRKTTPPNSDDLNKTIASKYLGM